MRKHRKYLNSNLPSFIKLTLELKKVDILFLTKKLGVSEENIDQLFSHNLIGKESRTLLIRIINELKLDENKIFCRDLTFEKIRNSFFTSFFYCFDSRKEYYNQLKDYKKNIEDTPYIIDWLLIDFVYSVILIKDKKKVNELINVFQIIFFSMSDYYKKLFSIYLIENLKNNSMFEKCISILIYSLKIKNNDKHLNGRLYYTAMSVYRGIGNIEKAKMYFVLARDSFSTMSNYAMLENLNMKYSILLRSIGELKEALRNDVHLLEEYTIKHYRLRNIEILYNNIAWNYSLLHDYRNAVLYYKKALESLQDNDILFNMAYCCYKIGEKPQALHYIKMGKKALSCGEYIYNLLDWLELVIKAKYCAKTLDILNITLSKYNDDIESNYRTTIQIEIVNYYYYNHMYEEAVHALQPLMGKQLISPSELLFVNKEDKSDEDSLFFDENVDEDLFFDDDWEELEDCITEFTNS